MNRLTEVRCDYTGGGIYVYSALYNGEVWLYGGLDNYLGSYDRPGQVIEETHGCDYETYWKNPAVPFPTWREILESVREACPEYVYRDVRRMMEHDCTDMDKRCIGEDE